jgi:hypothetical protein
MLPPQQQVQSDGGLTATLNGLTLQEITHQLAPCSGAAYPVRPIHVRIYPDGVFLQNLFSFSCIN